MRRLPSIAALLAACVAAVILGTTGAALRTDAGRRLVAGAGLTVLNAQIPGSVQVGEVSGSFLQGLVLRNVVLRGPTGDSVLGIERLSVRYRLLDLLRFRLAFGQAVIERPAFVLHKPAPGARFTFESALGIGGEGPGGRPPLIAFTDVVITDGSAVITTPGDPPRAHGDGENGPWDERRVHGLNARLGYLRLASPFPEEEGVFAGITSLAVEVSDPALRVHDARGTAEFRGDSALLDLDELVLAETEARVRGTLHWPADTVLVDVTVEAARLRTDDARGLVPDLPAGLTGRGDFVVRSVSGDVIELTGERVVLDGRRRGGRVAGTLGLVLGPGDRWAARRTDLTLTSFDLEFVRAFLDTLPLAGRVTGAVAADGPRESLRLGLDVLFRDSLVSGWPETTLRGVGIVSAGATTEPAFRRFDVRHAHLSLATVERLVPAIALRGHVIAEGTLDGPASRVTFDGELRYADPPLPETVVRGALRLDTRGEIVGIWGGVVFDSLRLAGFGSSLRGPPLAGTWGGRMSLAGFLDSLTVDADLGGASGELGIDAAVRLVGGGLGAPRADVQLQRLDLSGVAPELPSSRLTGRVVGRGELGAQGAVRFEGEVALGRSRVEGVRVDSATGRLGVADSLVRIDTLSVWSTGVFVRGRGSVGLAAPRQGRIALTAVADSLEVLEPLLARWLGALDTTTSAIPTSGRATLTAEVVGALDAYQVTGELHLERFRRAGLGIMGAEAQAFWASTGRFGVSARMDSATAAGLRFTTVETHLTGRPDSIAWRGSTRFGAEGRWAGGGAYLADSLHRTIAVDSMTVDVATGTWVMDTSAVVTVGDSGIDFSSVVLTTRSGPARVAVAGRLPFAGPGRLSAAIEALPLRDIWQVAQSDIYQEVDGELNGTLTLAGTARDPEIELTMAVRDGLVGTFRAPYTEGTVRYAARRMVGELRLLRLAQEVLSVELDLPVDLGITGVDRRRLPGPLSIRAVADSFDLVFLSALTPGVRRTAGTVDADVGVAGTWDRPQLTGRVQVRDGAATLPGLGVRHRDVNARFRLSGDSIHVEEVAVRSGPGTARVTGVVRLVELSRPVLDLQVQARTFRALDVEDFLRLTASADLSVTGPFLEATVSGRGTATRGVLFFADLITKDVINLDDPFFAQFVDTTLIRRQGLGTGLESRFLDSLRVDSLRLEMGADMWLRSGEANVQLAGAVIVNKVRDRYALSGTLRTPRGTYRLAIAPTVTREFTVTRGEVRYFGTPDLNADLDIDARHIVRRPRAEDVTIFVHIGGTLYEPRLTLSSDIRPPIAETEIISYLLFGQPSVQAVAQGRAGENQQVLDQAVARLFGALSSQLEYSLISDLGIPIDYLQIRPGTGPSGTEIAVGKQFEILGTSAFLTASPRICPRSQVLSFETFGASLEFRLTRAWLLAASIDPTRSCETFGGPANIRHQFGIDLFWETSY